MNHWWDDGANAIAFSRGDKGFVAINRESASLSVMLATGLQPGTYCDLLTGGRDATGCKGQVLVVTTNGMAQVDISANSAIAVDIDSRR